MTLSQSILLDAFMTFNYFKRQAFILAPFFFFLTVGVLTHIGNIGHTCLLQIKQKGQ